MIVRGSQQQVPYRGDSGLHWKVTVSIQQQAPCRSGRGSPGLPDYSWSLPTCAVPAVWMVGQLLVINLVGEVL